MTLKTLKFLGASRRQLKAFPEAAQDDAGYQLYRVQLGLEPSNWKPMPSIGPGVREIRISDKTGIFRVIYVTRAETVDVLQAIHKKTQRTTSRDRGLAKARLRRK